MKKKYWLFILFFPFLIFSQNIDLRKLDNEIARYNQLSQHDKSQKRLLEILTFQKISDHERAIVNQMLAETYRSLNDYPTTIKFLEEAKKYAHSTTENDSLEKLIEAKIAFVYFDSNNYAEADKIMQKINRENYKNLNLQDKGYIIMQEGFILHTKKDYFGAEKKYEEALNLLNENSRCNAPVVMVKQMQLLGDTGRLGEAEVLYQKILQHADQCKIVKYKVYATEELKRIFERANDFTKAGYYAKELERYNHIYDRDEKLSKLHLDQDSFVEALKTKIENQSIIEKIIYAITTFLLLFFVIYFFRTSFKNKKEKEKAEAELSRMQQELDNYIHLNKEKFTPEQKKEEIIRFAEKLTERQKELLKYMAEGKTNREIAEKLFITEATVKYHIKNIYEVLELKNRKEFFTKITKKD